MFGSHLSISGGLHEALLSAEKLGLETVQVFTRNPRTFGFIREDEKNSGNGRIDAKPPETKGKRPKWVPYLIDQFLTKNQQQWRCPPLCEASIDEWAAHRKRLKFKQTVSHDSYLINLASPFPELWEKSVALFIEEVRRCVSLGIPLLVTHPGAHMGEGEETGCRRVAAALNVVHDAVPTGSVVTCLEITAGQGSSLGYKLEHLADIMEHVKSPARVGVCLDTAHLFAAGYDFRGRRYAKFCKQVESTVGISKVKVLHLNDSKRELGSRVDRHEHIGRGTIGLDGFRPFVRDKSFAKTPKIIETPKGAGEGGRSWDAINIEALRALE